MYGHPEYHLRENIYRSSDKSISIYKERKSNSLRFIAVKIYNKKKHKNFDYEYKILKKLNHPSVVKVYDACEDNHHFYVELEYCPSSDLSYSFSLNKSTNYNEKVIKSVSTELLLGLKHIHSNGIIHCNLKPSNILINEFGNTKICDFKKALIESEITADLIRKNKSALTPCYTAPELFQESGTYSIKSDLWALGCIMYEMASGQVPFFDESVTKLINKINNGQVNFDKKELRNYSDEFIEVLEKLLIKDPNNRPGWGEIDKMTFWDIEQNDENNNDNDEIIENSDSIGSLNSPRKATSSRDLSISNLNFVSISQSKAFPMDDTGINNTQKNSNKLNSDNINTNKNNIQLVNNNSCTNNEEDEDDYSNNNNNNKDIDNTDKELNFKEANDGNNNKSNNNEQINDDYYDNNENGIDLNKNNNILGFSVLNISKVVTIDKRSCKDNNIQDLTISSAKTNELPQIQTIMIHSSDKIVKPIIGNKIIEPHIKPTTYETKKIPLKLVLKIEKIKELIQHESTKKLEKYLLNIYKLMDAYRKNNNQELLLNIINYFETIILAKEVANNIINTSFIKLIIDFMDIDNDNIKIRSCSIIAYIIRYATAMDSSLDEFHLCEKLIKFIHESNIDLNKKAISTLGEYLFFVATQIEGDDEDIGKGKLKWEISKESLNTLLYCLRHKNEIVKFYALKTIENITILTSIAKKYFASDDNYLFAIIDIFKTPSDNSEIKSCSISTISHLIRQEPKLLKKFLDNMNNLNELIDKENPKNKQFLINCLLFGIVNNVDNVNCINLDLLMPSLIKLLETSEQIIKTKVILLLSFIFNENNIISKYGEKIFGIMQKLRNDKNKYYLYVKIFENFMINFCNNLYKFFIGLCQNSGYRNQNDIVTFLDAMVVISPYYKVSYILFKSDLLESLIKIILHSKNEKILDDSFEILKYFSENSYNIIQNIGYTITNLFINILNLSKKVNSNYKRFPLNICANILTIILEDEIYSINSEDQHTKTINSLIVSILPTINDLLKDNDTANDALSFLALIIEKNSAFIQYYNNFGIINYIFELMKDQNYFNNLNLVKIILKFIESKNLSFDEIISMKLIDKVNYLVEKDNIDDINIYSEYVIEMLYELIMKINEYKVNNIHNANAENRKSFINKICHITKNFKMSIKLLGCNNQNVQEKGIVILIFLIQNFPNFYIESTNIKIKFSSEDIPDLLKGLDNNFPKIHKKLIKVFTWIIEMQKDASKVLENYLSYIQIYVEKIKDTSKDPLVVEEATKLLDIELKKLKNN